jgi:hypothetical protein
MEATPSDRNGSDPSAAESNARKALARLLDGDPLNGTAPADCGRFAGEVEAVADAPPEKRADVFDALRRENPALKTLAPAGKSEERPTVGRRVSEIERERIRWLWRGRLALGELTIIDGDPGLGKSTLLCDVAARISAARPMPGEEGTPTGTEGGGVVIVTTEDSPAHTIRPRLEAAGANLDKCTVVETVPTRADDGSWTGPKRIPRLPEDLPALRFACEDVGARLLVIDPLMAHLGDANAHKDQDVRAALAPLSTLAEEQDMAVAVVRHLNKASGTNALYRGGGSIGIIGAFRIGLLFGEAPQSGAGKKAGGESRLALTHNKNNLGEAPASLALRLESSPDVPDVARVAWEGICDVSAGDLLQSSGGGGETHTPATDEAEDFLRAQLAGGPRLSAEVHTAREEAEISKRTVKRAKQNLGITSERIKPGSSRWYFVPPEDLDPAENPTGNASVEHSSHIQGQGEEANKADGLLNSGDEVPF